MFDHYPNLKFIVSGSSSLQIKSIFSDSMVGRKGMFRLFPLSFAEFFLTAVIKSAAKIDHLRTGGTLLNQKFTPQLLENEQGIEKLLHLIRSYFKMDGHHIQFNVVTAKTLRKAQAHPERYRDLIVRVAGYSDYFVDLGPELQNEIIRRTENENF